MNLTSSFQNASNEPAGLFHELLESSHNHTGSEKGRDNLTVARYLAVTFTALSVYILVVLFHHWCKNKVLQTHSSATKLCFVAAACSVVLCLTRIAELWVNDISCQAYHLTGTAIYGMGLGLVYTTVWIRQRKLYCDELLQQTVTKTFRIISAAIIVIIYFLLVVVFASFIAVLKFESVLPPCHIIWYPLSSLLPLVIFIILTCFFLQLALFILILHPLRRDKGIVQVLCSNSGNDVFALLKRLAICACACIFSTILLSIAILLDSLEIICIHWGNLMSLDLIISTLATVISFKDWHQRLFPLFSKFLNRDNYRFRHSVILDDPSPRGHFETSLKKKLPEFVKKRQNSYFGYFLPGAH